MTSSTHGRSGRLGEPLRKAAAAWLRELADQQMRRTLSPVPEGALNLCSNDYLGLVADEAWQEELRREVVERAGAGASRLLGGENRIYAEWEEGFSRFRGTEASLFFSSGYMANEAVVQTLARLDAHFFSDRLNHASLIDGCRMARLDRRHLTVFPHSDVDALARALKSSRPRRGVILTESIFSMDGDAADLRGLYEVASEHEALLVVDEAHAIGVFGRDGRGWMDELGLPASEVVTVNPLGKAWGVQGAIVSGPRWFREALINAARPFVYTTGPSPWLARAAWYTLQHMPRWVERRRRVRELAIRFRESLRDMNWEVGEGVSPIVPIVVGSASAALDLSQHLLDAGFFCRAIRPPTVPEGTCRVRISLTAAVTDAQVERLIESVRGWRPRA